MKVGNICVASGSFIKGTTQQKPQRGKLLANAVGGESFHSSTPQLRTPCSAVFV